MEFNRLIPELTVSDLEKSKCFYVDLLGFCVEYERREDKFAFLSLEGIQLMLEEWHEDGWNVAELGYPFGRGVNFSMEVDDIEQIYAAVRDAGYPLYRPLKVGRYESGGEWLEQKEFLLQDPDGYLLRFTQE